MRRKAKDEPKGNLQRLTEGESREKLLKGKLNPKDCSDSDGESRPPKDRLIATNTQEGCSERMDGR